MRTSIRLGLLFVLASVRVVAADLKLLWQLDVGINDSYWALEGKGVDGSVVVKTGGKSTGTYFWISSKGKKIGIVATGETPSTWVVLAVSDKALLATKLPATPTATSTAKVIYFENQSDQVVRQDWTIQGSLLEFTGLGGNQFAVNSATNTQPLFFWQTSTNILSSYTLTSSLFSISAATNRLSQPTITANGFAVTANTELASSLTIEKSTNLSFWEQVITIQSPRTSEAVIVPLLGSDKLFLRLKAQ